MERGAAVRIATGAPIPERRDAVVPVEQTTPLDAAGVAAGPRGRDATGPLPAAIAVHQAVPVGGSIRPRGERPRGGDHDPRGRHARDAGRARASRPASASISCASTAGRSSGSWRPGMRSARQAGSSARPASRTRMARASWRWSTRQAVKAATLGIAADRFDDVRARLCAGLFEADAIIVSGGVSVGPYDVVRAAFEEFGTIDLWRVAVQPGKPFAFGTARAPGDDGSDPDATRDAAVRPAREPGLARS